MQIEASHLSCASCGAVFRQNLARCPGCGNALTRLPRDPHIGTLIAGRYIIEEIVGQGSTGRVYRAREMKRKRQVAIKVLYGDLAASPNHRARLEREAAGGKALQHPNLVAIRGHGRTPSGLPYLVMEFISGRSLAQLVLEEAPLPAARVRRLLADICRALAYVHTRGIIHRDLKGGNVMVHVDADGEEIAKLFDFGVALVPASDAHQRLTGQRIAIGTMTYMAPEQALTPDVDHRADLFSLGVILYQMLTGVNPFQGPPTLAALRNVTARPPPVTERVPGLKVSPALEAMAIKLMAKRPRDRYQSADEVLKQLDAIGDC
jgi:serine/threonine-protein kinase